MAARASDLNGKYWPVVATATLLRWSAPNSQVGIMSAKGLGRVKTFLREPHAEQDSVQMAIVVDGCRKPSHERSVKEICSTGFHADRVFTQPGSRTSDFTEGARPISSAATKSGHSVVHVCSAALCRFRTFATGQVIVYRSLAKARRSKR